jgi:hypothetical protein
MVRSRVDLVTGAERSAEKDDRAVKEDQSYTFNLVCSDADLHIHLLLTFMYCITRCHALIEGYSIVIRYSA